MFEGDVEEAQPAASGRGLRSVLCAVTVVLLVLATSVSFIVLPLVLEDRGMHLFESFEHFGWQGNQMRPCPLVQGGMGKYIDQTKMKTMHQAVLVLHNSTVPHHVDVLEVIEHAQIRRDLIFLKHDCHYERGPCGSLGHGEVHLHEPPLMFYHYGQRSESFHDDIQQGLKPFGSRDGTNHKWHVDPEERMHAILEWADAAAHRADDKLMEREFKIAQIDADHRQRQAKMYEDALKARAEMEAMKQAEAEGAKFEL